MLAYKKILVPVDFEKISHSAVTQAASHSESSNSELLVVHVIDAPDTDESVVTDAERKLEQLLDQLEIGYCEKLVEVGDTVPTLLSVIQRKNIDLVIMGTHKRESVPEWYQSITLEIASNTECDVLVLHK